MPRKNYYITTTLPYVNAEPHIGFALEIVQADVLARYHRLLGDNVIFNFGTDEHGQKILEKAHEEGKDPQKYVDEYAAKFDTLKNVLNLSYDIFIRTTNPHHVKAARHFWELCDRAGYIYKKNYQSKYCVGCELEKTDSELENGKCPLHPNKPLQLIAEENYFFKFSAFQKPLLDFYQNNPDFVVPEFRFNEIKSFVKSGLNDFSISRLKEKMPWGIPVPGDADHVIYVWFDALVNYISTLEWPQKDISAWWPGVQLAGKDNLRQQAAIWQAMLLAAGLPNSKQIFIHGFISINGQKISKSSGNSISPFELTPKYGTDPVRYYLLSKVHPFEDSDFTLDKFDNAYTDNLANDLGNLIARVAKLAENLTFPTGSPNQFPPQIHQSLSSYRFDQALEFLWSEIKNANALINQTKLWELTGSKKADVLTALINQIRAIAFSLQPFLPETAQKIINQFKDPQIKSGQILFPKLK